VWGYFVSNFPKSRLIYMFMYFFILKLLTGKNVLRP